MSTAAAGVAPVMHVFISCNSNTEHLKPKAALKFVSGGDNKRYSPTPQKGNAPQQDWMAVRTSIRQGRGSTVNLACPEQGADLLEGDGPAERALQARTDLSRLHGVHAEAGQGVAVLDVLLLQAQHAQHGRQQAARHVIAVLHIVSRDRSAS